MAICASCLSHCCITKQRKPNEPPKYSKSAAVTHDSDCVSEFTRLCLPFTFLTLKQKIIYFELLKLLLLPVTCFGVLWKNLLGKWVLMLKKVWKALNQGILKVINISYYLRSFMYPWIPDVTMRLFKKKRQSLKLKCVSDCAYWWWWWRVGLSA